MLQFYYNSSIILPYNIFFFFFIISVTKTICSNLINSESTSPGPDLLYNAYS